MTLARRKGIAPAESEAIAQALVRHKSPESIRRYGRWQRGDYADWIAQAMPVDTAQSVSLPLPVLFFDEDMQQLTQLANDLDDKNHEPAPKAHSKKRPTPDCSSLPPAESPIPQRTYTLSDGKTVSALGPDSWDLVGEDLDIPNKLWDNDDPSSNSTHCVIVAFIGDHVFKTETAPAFVIQWTDDKNNNELVYDAVVHHYIRSLIPYHRRKKLTGKPTARLKPTPVVRPRAARAARHKPTPPSATQRATNI